MRYATWQLYWQPDERYGSGPESAITERGGSAEPIMFLGPDPHDTIVGYVYGDVSVADLDDWAVTEVTAAEALSLVQGVIPDATLGDDGRIVWSLDDPVG